jgi:DedD protein
MARPISDEEIQLKRRARRRLIGAIVLVTVIVVALPMVLDTEPRPLTGEVSIKIPSPDSGEFTSRVVPVAPGDAKAPPASRLSTEMKSAPKPPSQPPAAAKTVPEKVAKAPSEQPAKPAARPEAPAKSPKPPARQPAAPQKAGAPPFVVQVIALADADKARQIQSQIAAAGIKAYTEVVKTAKGDVTRVRAGPFATREAAEKARDQLKGIGLSGNVASK